MPLQNGVRQGNNLLHRAAWESRYRNTWDRVYMGEVGWVMMSTVRPFSLPAVQHSSAGPMSVQTGQLTITSPYPRAKKTTTSSSVGPLCSRAFLRHNLALDWLFMPEVLEKPRKCTQRIFFLCSNKGTVKNSSCPYNLRVKLLGLRFPRHLQGLPCPLLVVPSPQQAQRNSGVFYLQCYCPPHRALINNADLCLWSLQNPLCFVWNFLIFFLLTTGESLKIVG